MTQKITEYDLACLRVIETALSHPHCFDRAVEVHHMYFSNIESRPNIGTVRALEVQHVGFVKVAEQGQDTVQFTSRCLLSVERGKIIPLYIDLRCSKGVVVGRCEVKENGSGIREYQVYT
jgi:hypothetical protein